MTGAGTARTLTGKDEVQIVLHPTRTQVTGPSLDAIRHALDGMQQFGPIAGETGGGTGGGTRTISAATRKRMRDAQLRRRNALKHGANKEKVLAGKG